jgi:hypothetical protein
MKRSGLPHEKRSGRLPRRKSKQDLNATRGGKRASDDEVGADRAQ